jgi:transcriptional regulator with XRE-family HTH domain
MNSLKISNKLKTFRALKSFTQKDLAEKIGISFQTLSNWENDIGEPSFTHILNLVDMGMSIDFILHGIGSPLKKESNE